ncbi:MAG: hypothetical protein AAFV01_16775, partial [Bacteroidota bacterium]
SCGFVYAAIGRRYVEMSVLSAQQLETSNVTIFTLDYEDGLRLCDEEAAVGPGWRCVDLAEQITSPRLPELKEKTWSRVVLVLRCLRVLRSGDDEFDVEKECPTSEDGRKDTMRFASRVSKVFSMLLSPYDVSMFLDSDTLPCANGDGVKALLSGSPANRSLPEVFDVLGAIAHTGSLEVPIQASDPPTGFYTVNTGMLLVQNKRPAVRAFLAHWLHLVEKRVYEREHRLSDHSTLDQPAFRVALFDALASRNLTFYMLPPMWNFRAWNGVIIGTKSKDAVTEEKHHCCDQDTSGINRRIVIDHKCLYKVLTLPSGRAVAEGLAGAPKIRSPAIS